ncbi:hypothetical protein F444_18165 [Phytophthora nicotianae P1976]|uniref:Uncharacterized protein n=1 Tax=Phytophthora nicotianae P1976 TaxID=1317066 RepID=A0A080ZCB3_PHYNI|nr:hypothetical protein F444_18165 [Phytophthora nicotianae P1976]
MRLRVLLRGSDVCDVVTTLREIRPGVSEVGSYLATHEVKTSASKRAPKWSIEDNFVPSRVRFRLPEEVISNALNFLKTEIRDGDTEIELGSDRERTDDTNGSVVTFERLGQFRREQLEAMQWLWNLQSACREAVLCCTWLTRSVKEVEDDTSPAHVAFLQILECWPYAALKGFGFDLSYAAIFCLRDSQWLNDAVMRAVGVSLSRFKNNQTVMLPPPTSDRQRGDILQEKAIRSIARAVASRPFVLMLVNLGGFKWDQEPKEVEEAGGRYHEEGTETYNEVDVTKPKQKDGNNCEVFVSLFFWRCVSAEAPSDVVLSDLSPSGITKLRWALLRAILKMKQR